MKAGISGEKRRGEILKILAAASGPVSAAVLAEKLSVSRQIIVGDISLLRAGGENILSTPRGYLMERPSAGLIKTVVCLHRGEDMEKELNIMVDNGCQVLDVVVDHPIYGQLSGRLLLSTRSDVEKFVCDVAGKQAPPLSSLTGGIHIHTLSCPDLASYDRVLRQLEQAGFLYTKND